tara:strand:- start:138 stop:1847 length:1710 start_codon:yes stop_codon:yes gene_type:complete
MAIDKTIKLNIDAEDVIKKLEKIEKDLEGVKKGVQDNTEQMDGLGKSAKTTAQGMTTLAGGIGVVALALKALAISGVMRLFDMFFTVLQNNQTVLDATNKAFETINITVRSIINSFVDLEEEVVGFGDFFKKIWDTINAPLTSFLDGLGLMGTALKKLFEGEFKQAAGAAILGAQKIRDGILVVPAAVDDMAAPIVKTFKTITDSAKETAASVVELRNQIILNEAEQRKIQLTTLKDAEEQRQIRDDVSKNIEDRIEANTRLGEILQKGFQDEMLIAKEKLELAQLELSTDEKNVELKAALKNAEADILEIQERITGQTSEQLVNETALNDERIANLQELSDVGKSEYDRQINDIKVQQAQKRKLALRTIKDEKKLQKTLVAIDNDAAKQKADIERKLGQQKRDMAVSYLGQVADIIGKQSAAGKALSVAQALINTYSSAAAALAPPPVGAGPIFGPIAAAIAMIAGMKSVHDIISTPLPKLDGGTVSSGGLGGLGGGGGGGGGGTPDIIPTPELGGESGGLGGASLIPNLDSIPSQGLGLPPIQAYVVENDISNAQALQEELETQATL